MTKNEISPSSSLPAPERAIFFVATKEDATVKPWHDEIEWSADAPERAIISLPPKKMPRSSRGMMSW
jgi:hypothetical protein